MRVDGRTIRRWAIGMWPLVQQTAAAAAAWVIAVRLVGQEPPPFFAPIAAVVALNATLGQRGSNALRLLVGAVVGVVVGQIAVAVAGGGVWTLTVAAFCAMAVARLIDGARIVTAQAAIGAILITAFGDPDEGTHRLVEALIGVGVALVLSQVVFSPDPLLLLRRAEEAVLSGLADGLRLAASALEHDDEERSAQALDRLRDLRELLAELGSTRRASDRIVRHSLTWRSQRTPVVRERESAGQLDLLATSCLTLVRAVVRTTPVQRRTLAPSVRRLAQSLADLAEQPGDRPTRQRAAEHALDLARWVVEHRPVAADPAMAAACAAVQMVAVDVMVFAGVEPAQAMDAVHTPVEGPQVAEPPRRARPHAAWLRAGRRRQGRTG